MSDFCLFMAGFFGGLLVMVLWDILSDLNRRTRVRCSLCRILFFGDNYYHGIGHLCSACEQDVLESEKRLQSLEPEEENWRNEND